MPRKCVEPAIQVVLDAADRKWLAERGYPFGVDAAGYLRMMVRQARLAPLSTREQRGEFRDHNPLIHTVRGPELAPPPPPLLAAMGDDGLDPGHPGGEVDVDRFADAVVGDAEANGLIAPAQQGDEAPGADVVLIGERRQRSAKEWASG
jgi:hypothetical protein